MARVFTTTFQYDSRTYTALVTELENSLTITMVDGTLQLVVPLGELPLSAETEPEANAAHRQEVQSLVRATLQAVNAARTRQPRGTSPVQGQDDSGIVNG